MGRISIMEKLGYINMKGKKLEEKWTEIIETDYINKLTKKSDELIKKEKWSTNKNQLNKIPHSI